MAPWPSGYRREQTVALSSIPDCHKSVPETFAKKTNGRLNISKQPELSRMSSVRLGSKADSTKASMALFKGSTSEANPVNFRRIDYAVAESKTKAAGNIWGYIWGYKMRKQNSNHL